jgi:hypothetical protein
MPFSSPVEADPSFTPSTKTASGPRISTSLTVSETIGVTGFVSKLFGSLWPKAGENKETASKKSTKVVRMALGFGVVKISKNPQSSNLLAINCTEISIFIPNGNPPIQWLSKTLEFSRYLFSSSL